MKTSAVFGRGGLILLLIALFFFTPAISTRAQAEETATAESPALVTETVTTVPNEAPVVDGGYVSNEILVQINQKASQPQVFSALEGYGELRETVLAKIGVYVLVIPDGDIAGKIGAVRNITGMVFAEPNYFVSATDIVPNDPGFAGQYSYTAIRAPQGWEFSTGSAAVTIAILDSGVDLGHPDLAGKTVSGYDFVNGDSVPQDDFGHGTHVAGIAAATGNNGVGIAGISWGARVMPVKVLDFAGNGSYANVAAGVIWAADHGAQIINLSLGGANYSATLDNAITYAVNQGVLVIAASGNSGSNLVLYPARDSDVLGVAAVDSSNQHASYSNYGDEVDVAAPGSSIYSLYTGGGYSTLSGTSMSTPFVSGLAAILFGLGGNSSSVRHAIEDTALDVESPGWDMFSGFGLIQMDAAILWILPPTTHSDEPTFFVPIAGLYLSTASPTLTRASSPTPVPASATVTVSPTPSASVTPTPAAATATSSPTVLPPSALSRFAKRLTVFRSAPFCGGALLILLGLLLFWLMKRKRR